MMRSRTIADVEADLSALRSAAERAGLALGCLFSTSDEFEAAMLRARAVTRSARPRASRWIATGEAIATGLLSAAFLLV